MQGKAAIQDSLPASVMENILEAMVRQSRSASDRFPRLLELIAAYPKIQPAFVEKVFITLIFGPWK